jgi:hypothetical protein
MIGTQEYEMKQTINNVLCEAVDKDKLKIQLAAKWFLSFYIVHFLKWLYNRNFPLNLIPNKIQIISMQKYHLVALPHKLRKSYFSENPIIIIILH